MVAFLVLIMTETRSFVMSQSEIDFQRIKNKNVGTKCVASQFSGGGAWPHLNLDEFGISLDNCQQEELLQSATGVRENTLQPIPVHRFGQSQQRSVP